MIIVDTRSKRAAAGNPVRVGMIGAGFMARGHRQPDHQLGPRHAARRDREPHARNAEPRLRGSRRRTTSSGRRRPPALEDADARPGATRSRTTRCSSAKPTASTCILEVTGAIEFGGAGHRSRAIEHGKHVVTMNAELDGTVGPILKTYADKAGVIFSGCDGDQPGVEMNLYRFVQRHRPDAAGLRQHQGPAGPVPQPDDAEGLRREVGPEPAHGHELRRRHEDQLRAGDRRQRHRHDGRQARHVRRGPRRATSTSSRRPTTSTSSSAWAASSTTSSAPSPAPGVFVLATHDDPKQRHYLNLYKLGEGPLYSFYTPYHLCHFEVPLSVARVVAVQRRGAAADRRADGRRRRHGEDRPKAGDDHRRARRLHDLRPVREQPTSRRRERLLPMGLAEGCRLVSDVPADQVLTYADVELPAGRLADRLRAEQDSRFGVAR